MPETAGAAILNFVSIVVSYDDSYEFWIKVKGQRLKAQCVYALQGTRWKKDWRPEEKEKFYGLWYAARRKGLKIKGAYTHQLGTKESAL